MTAVCKEATISLIGDVPPFATLNHDTNTVILETEVKPHFRLYRFLIRQKGKFAITRDTVIVVDLRGFDFHCKDFDLKLLYLDQKRLDKVGVGTEILFEVPRTH